MVDRIVPTENYLHGFQSGSASKGFQNVGHYGFGKHAFKNDGDAIKFVQHLIILEILAERFHVQKSHYTMYYLR